MKKLLMLAAIMTCCGTWTMSLTSCSADDNPVYVEPSEPEVGELTEEEYLIKRYINAANERECVSEEERTKTYEPFMEWRLDSRNNEEALYALRFATDTFDFESENAKKLPHPDYVPSRSGLDELSLSGSGRPSKQQLEALALTLKEKAGNRPIWIVDLRAEMHGIINGRHLSRYGFRNWGTIGMKREQIIMTIGDCNRAVIRKTICQ